MSHIIRFTPKAQQHLADIYDYIAAAASPEIARRFTDAIVDHIGGFADFPHRGSTRDDIRPGLRTTSWRRRVTIAYAVDPQHVIVIGIFYGGQDFEAMLAEG